MSFDSQPVLTGELLELRPLRADDFNDLYAVAADPLIWEQHPVKTRHDEAGFGEFFRESLASGGALIATDTRTRQVIGSSRFHGYDGDKGEVEIGWTFLARSHWGGTYNAEMKHLMMRHAFKSVDRVLFLVGTHNLRSQRAVEKIGGTRVGTISNGRDPDSFVYHVSKSDRTSRSPEQERPVLSDKKINYLELPARDFDAVQTFYEDAFGWTFTEYGPEYRAFNDGTIDGGFYKSEASSSTSNGAALIVLYAVDLEGTRDIVVRNGGAIVKEIFAFPGGRRFHFADPNGNELAVWSDK